MSDIIWALAGLVLVLIARWLRARSVGRDAAVRLRQQPDPFVDRRAMLRYHAALRSEGR